jgi:hypothetical protein
VIITFLDKSTDTYREAVLLPTGKPISPEIKHSVWLINIAAGEEGSCAEEETDRDPLNIDEAEGFRNSAVGTHGHGQCNKLCLDFAHDY